MPSILDKGLLPWDTPGIGSKYDRDLEPRPNHVYLRTHDSAKSDRGVVRVDLRKLDPANLNPDEDMIANASGAQRWGWPMMENEHGADWPKLHPYNSWGEWAEGIGANQPSQTAWSLEVPDQWGGSLAHRGPIPPEAIDYPWSQQQ